MIERYTIKPLKWEEGEIEYPGDYLEASTPFGYYEVTMRNEEKITWGYWRSEDDEQEFVVESVEAGKQAAFEHWKQRLLKVLEPCTEKTDQ